LTATIIFWPKNNYVNQYPPPFYARQATLPTAILTA